MIGENSPDSVVGSKKRSLTSPGVLERPTSEGFIMSPPTKKLKQARLPFKVIPSSCNQCPESPVTEPLLSKKRKLSGSDKSPASSQPTKLKSSDVKSNLKKTTDNPAKKFFIKKSSTSPLTPQTCRIETIDLEPEVTSSCEDQEPGKVASSCITPKRSLSSKPKSLDSFLQTTQQPQVSTSDEVIDISDDDVNEAESSDIQNSTSKETHDEAASFGASAVVDAKCLQENNQATSLRETEELPVTASDETDDDKSPVSPSKLDVSMTASPGDPNVASKLGYDADSEDGSDDEGEQRDHKSSEGSDGVKTSTNDSASTAGIITPGKTIGKPVKKTPLSAKALKKMQEKEKKREEKIKLRMEKKRKLEEEEAERKRLKLELKKEKEREREETKRQKEMEKDEKRKEKQQKKEQEEKEKEQKRMAKEEERKKKQEIADAKMEEKRKKTEERQRQEDEKRQQEDEKRKKETKQKDLFKNFFKEAAAPVKKPQEKSSGWFAPFEVKEFMVLAPVLRSERLLEAKEEFEMAFREQSSSSLYLDELRSSRYTAGKMGATPQAKTEEPEDIRRTTTPSAEAMTTPSAEVIEKDSEDVEIVSEEPAKPPKKLVRMKCKLLQFHENYRPAYYGTWRQRSKRINPRNFLKKDEELLDYDIDSDDEWEEPGESLSHSEGEEEGEDEDGGVDSDDGFFVPHGYLSESEGCEDEEEIESWKARRAAKAKSWEAELKRQQGILKPVVVGCEWMNNSTSANKILAAFKIVALTAVPIDTRSRKQILASVEAQPLEESSKMSAPPKSCASEGVSMKRPVPAEAMPDLIRLVHGNTAGIRTLQREFREYWRLKDLSKKPGRNTPTSPETTSKTPTAEASLSVKSPEALRTSGAVSPCVSEAADVEVSNPPAVKPEPSTALLSRGPLTPAKDATPGSDIETSSPASAGQTPPSHCTGDPMDCSISKRQLLITITAIAVRDKRPPFSRTCWYVHQDLLEKHNLQNLPIPSQWQMITRPQKALRPESPLVGQSLSVFSNQQPSSYASSAAGSQPVVTQQNQRLHVGPVHQSLNPALFISPNSIYTPQPSGMLAGTHIRLQGNTVRENLAAARSNLLNPPPGGNIQQSLHQSGGIALPLQLQPANGMLASEIMQRLSATVPLQHHQGAAVSHSIFPQMAMPSPSAMPTNHIHYLNTLPKPYLMPHSTAPMVGSSSAASQIHRADNGHVVKVPSTSPTDIKAMLSSQAGKLAAANSASTANPVSSAAAVSQVATTPNSVPRKCPTPTTSGKDESAAAPSLQQPARKTTLERFFNVSVKPLPKSQPKCSQAEKSDSVSAHSEKSPRLVKTKEESVSEGLVQAMETADCKTKLEIPETCDGKEKIEKAKFPVVKMDVIASSE